MRYCALSVDLDEIRHYYGIHGLGSPPRASEHAVYDRALQRYWDFSSSERVPLTLFAVGADLERPENRARLRTSVERGHEIGNHTQDHLYDLSRRPSSEIREQIDRASALIAEATGEPVRGFRAPGYVMSQRVYEVLGERGLYSSSVFPCPYYYAAKLAALTRVWLTGKRSASVLDAPFMLAAPTTPYRVGKPYWRPGNGVVELPIQVTPRARLPVFGTSLTLLGPKLGRRLVRQLLGVPFINLELHGVDLLDEHDDLQALGARQFDLRIAFERKRATLVAVVAELRAEGYEFVRLDTAADRFS